MATLVLDDLRKSFGKVPVLHGVDLALKSGEMLVIVGASGCGKSTLLRLVAGLEEPTAGRIVLDGTDVATRDPAERDIAMVFQNYALYPHMSVFDNMAYGLRIRALPAAEIRRRVDEAAGLLELSALLDRKPRQLSGGQRQRVAMGRAIVREPKLFLFDEPLSNLDATLRVTMRAEIRRLQRRMGVTSLFVTHDQVEAMTLGDRLLVLHKGRAVQLATPMEVFNRPANTYVAGFIGAPAMNLLAGTLTEGGRSAQLAIGQRVVFADGPRPGPEGRKLVVGIRPEHLRRDDQGFVLPVDLVEPLGSETVVIGKLDDGTMLTIKLPGANVSETSLRVSIPPEHLHVFDAETGLRLDPS
jgi:sn-glycerol 3-phosphate transport system ATP-binding protein